MLKATIYSSSRYYHKGAATLSGAQSIILGETPLLNNDEYIRELLYHQRWQTILTAVATVTASVVSAITAYKLISELRAHRLRSRNR